MLFAHKANFYRFVMESQFLFGSCQLWLKRSSLQQQKNPEKIVETIAKSVWHFAHSIKRSVMRLNGQIQSTTIWSICSKNTIKKTFANLARL